MGAVAPVTQWIPEDDVLLKKAVDAGASLECLARGAVPFSWRFSVQELRERWHSLLYDPKISEEASARMIEVEIEVPMTNYSKFKKSCGFNGKNGYGKRKVDSVRSHYYAMRKLMHRAGASALDAPSNPFHRCVDTCKNSCRLRDAGNSFLRMPGENLESFRNHLGVGGMVSAQTSLASNLFGSDLIELQNSLLNFGNDELMYLNVESKDMSLDGLSSILLSSPNDEHIVDMPDSSGPEAVTPIHSHLVIFDGTCIKGPVNPSDRSHSVIAESEKGVVRQLPIVVASRQLGNAGRNTSPAASASADMQSYLINVPRKDVPKFEYDRHNLNNSTGSLNTALKGPVFDYQNNNTKKAIIRLEQGARAYMQRAITSHGAFAVLYGRRMKHYIKKTKVSLERGAEDIHVDIDLGREGRANKISHRRMRGMAFIFEVNQNLLFIMSQKEVVKKRRRKTFRIQSLGDHLASTSFSGHVSK
ncbi:hypothetical protein QJS10_CPB20g01111 [Acorus calamus]|uniref:Microspherule protein N-terminal domain-containing protein n=1 Tax=Acorus calamus TaxID=4465 RepID=A0AAV9CC33_ACOCL|nr:hypothetical protein QJS10_CPB20g01111 [Acorus calamus]